MRYFTTGLTCVAMSTVPAFFSPAVAQDDPYYAALDHRARLGITVRNTPFTLDNGHKCLRVVGLKRYGIGGRVKKEDSICYIGDARTPNVEQFTIAVSRLKLNQGVRVVLRDHTDGVLKFFTGYPVPAYLNDDTIPTALRRCVEIYDLRSQIRTLLKRNVTTMDADEFSATENLRRYSFSDEKIILAKERCPKLDLP